MKTTVRPALLFPLLLLSMLALLTFWINKTVQPSPPKIDGSSRHDPDYIMSNFVTKQTDINGNLHFQLAAVEMRHFPDDDSTYLQRPRYTQFTIGKAPTQVEALRGIVSADGEKVELFGNVKITRPAFAGKGESTLDTDHLNIFPNQDIVRTESPVIIRQAPKTVVYGTGMLYEKKLGTVTLFHKVRAHYEKTSPSKAASQHSLAKANTTHIPTNTNNTRTRRRYE
jgi:lipopolysaccharide export system protein LptC